LPTTSGPNVEVLQVFLSHINAAMTHQFRELVDLSALLQVHAGKGMPKSVSRDTHLALFIALANDPNIIVVNVLDS